MNYLIYTHIFLWYFNADSRLTQKVVSIIENEEHDIYLSKANLWEITTKVSKGKLITKPKINDLEFFIFSNNIRLIDIEFEHLHVLQSLNQSIHSDLFDRLIVSQAISEKLILITDDETMKQYPADFLK